MREPDNNRPSDAWGDFMDEVFDAFGKVPFNFNTPELDAVLGDDPKPSDHPQGG